MPTYEYSCNDCGHQFDVVASIHDDSLTTCPNCGGNLRKLFGNVGVVFKGSGFYKTDSRDSGKSKKSATAAKPAAESTTSSSSEASSSASKESSTPATSPAKPTTSASSAKPTSD